MFVTSHAFYPLLEAETGYARTHQTRGLASSGQTDLECRLGLGLAGRGRKRGKRDAFYAV